MQSAGGEYYGGRRQRLLRCCLVGAMLLLGVTQSVFSQGVARQSKATSSRAAKEEAIRGIPFQNLNRAAQQRLSSVIEKPSMYRRMPISVINCDPEMHRFSIRHPEVIVNIWQLMGITQCTAERKAPYLVKCSDGVGTVTDIELIYGDRDTHILFCEGTYEGPLFRKPLTGRCILVLKSGGVTTERGHQITNRLDIFLQIDHAGLDIFAKTLHPLLGKSADINFTESLLFIERLSRAAENNNAGMQHMVERLEDIAPDIQHQFVQVIDNVHQRSRQRASAVAKVPRRTR